ncbi:MAG: pyridoxamine 5'-phosphate oxidase family protein [Lachnospiraceae bacterium]
MSVTEKQQKFISKCRTVCIGSVNENGFPNIKTMLYPRRVEEYKVFYFSTNTSSMRVSQFENNTKACLYFSNTILFKGIMLQGTVEVLHDSKVKELLWEKGDTKYYPLGVTDPDYCVLKFTIDDTEPRCYRI